MLVSHQVFVTTQQRIGTIVREFTEHYEIAFNDEIRLVHKSNVKPLQWLYR